MYAMYLRKSRKDDINDTVEDVLNRHYQTLVELADRLHIPLTDIDIYREVVSGESIAARPEMQNLLSKIEQSMYVGVMVVEVERLARGNSIDQGIITQAFQISNTKIITPLKTYDPSNESDEEFFEFGLFMSRREYKTINRRLKEGKIISCKNGLYVGSVPPYGYAIKRLKKGNTLEIIEHEAMIVKMIFEYKISGLGPSKIANELNKMGYKPRISDRWTYSSVLNIIENEVYCGVIVWNKRKQSKVIRNNHVIITRPRNLNYDKYEGKHDAIISKEIFDKANQIKKNNTRVIKSKTLKNPLAGLIYCQQCGRALQRKQMGDGQEFLLCKTEQCPTVSIKITVLEDYIINSIKETLEKYKRYIENYEEEFIKEVKSNKNLITQLQNDLNKLDNQLEKIYDLLETGAYDLELFKTRTSKINKQKDEICKRIETIQEAEKNDKTIRYKKAIPILENTIKLYHISSTEDKNKMLKLIIKKAMYNRDTRSTRSKHSKNEFNLDIFFNI